MLSPEQEIRLELESHLADQQEEFRRAGMTNEQARTKTQNLFGNVEEHVQASMKAYSTAHLIWHPTTWVCLASLSCLAITTVLFTILQGSSVQLMAEKVLIWNIFLSAVGVGVCLIRFLIEYFGFKALTVIYTSLVLSVLASFSVTNLLDLNNFEVTIHLLFLAIVVGVILQFTWPHLHLTSKRLFLYGFMGVSLLVAFTEYPLFEFLAPLRCAFIQPDQVVPLGNLPNCQQLPVWDPLVLGLFGSVVGGGIYFLFFLVRFLKNHSTAFYKKLVMVASVSSLGLAPMFSPGLNKHGQLDIIPWKVEIYAAYADILGRQPEQKDINFYAHTRAYQDMIRLKDVLYQSSERQLKIDLVYQEVLYRSATPEEIQFWVEQQATVEEIHAVLTNQTP